AERSPLWNVRQLDLEDERGVRRDRPVARRAIRERRRNRGSAQAADLHSGDGLLETGDDLPRSHEEVEGGARVELGSLVVDGGVAVQPSGFRHGYSLSGLRGSAGADREIDR